MNPVDPPFVPTVLGYLRGPKVTPSSTRGPVATPSKNAVGGVSVTPKLIAGGGGPPRAGTARSTGPVVFAFPRVATNPSLAFSSCTNVKSEKGVVPSVVRKLKSKLSTSPAAAEKVDDLSVVPPVPPKVVLTTPGVAMNANLVPCVGLRLGTAAEVPPVPESVHPAGMPASKLSKKPVMVIVAGLSTVL